MGRLLLRENDSSLIEIFNTDKWSKRERESDKVPNLYTFSEGKIKTPPVD